MISSLIGSVIMSAVTVAMLIAINYTDKALTEAGRYPLTSQERQILINAGFKLVDIPLVMTSGGPGISTETLTMHSWTQWRALDFGGSSAVAYTLLFVTVIICVSFFNFVIRKYSQANQL